MAKNINVYGFGENGVHNCFVIEIFKDSFWFN
jgi:hypothetical protein